MPWKMLFKLLITLAFLAVNAASALVPTLDTDHAGTPKALYSHETGEEVWSTDHEIYGKARDTQSTQTHPITGQPFEPNLRMQGQYEDQETGLYQNLHRYYDPNVGRYISADPIGLLGGLNAYQYCPNPVGYVDPLGLSSKECVKSYEVGAFNDLSSRSAVGDRLDIHHVTQKHPGAQVIDGYNPNTAPSIAIPANEHRRIPTIKGPYEGSARDLLAKDIRDLRNYTNAPNSALQELIEFNLEKFPESFLK